MPAPRADEPGALLRPARRDDVAGMHRVRTAVRENVLRDPGAITEAHYHDEIDRGGQGWVVERDGRIVGFAVARRDGEIWALFVDPAHEGRGIGRRLHAAMLGWLWRQGVPQARLGTGAGTRAQRFYEAAGWRATGVRPDGDVGYVLDNPTLANGATPMIQTTPIAAADAPPAAGGYAQALEVRGATRLLFVSGQIPVDADGRVPDGFEAQAVLAWRNVLAQLRAAGMTAANLVKVTTFLASREHTLANRAARQQALGSHAPALTVIVCGIFDDAWLLEIEAIAAG